MIRVLDMLVKTCAILIRPDAFYLYNIWNFFLKYSLNQSHNLYTKYCIQRDGIHISIRTEILFRQPYHLFRLVHILKMF